MILRRVIEHVKTQNWTALALDFAIVVGGVFIGIQVSNWNDARGEKALAQGYVEHIRRDIAADLREFDAIAAFTAKRRSAAEAVLHVLETGAYGEAGLFLRQVDGTRLMVERTALQGFEHHALPRDLVLVAVDGHLGLLDRELGVNAQPLEIFPFERMLPAHVIPVRDLDPDEDTPRWASGPPGATPASPATRPMPST